MASNLKRNAKNFLSIYFPLLLSLKSAFNTRKRFIINTKKLGCFGKHSNIAPPAILGTPENIFIGDYVAIHPNAIIYNSKQEKLIIKKHSAIAVNFVAILPKHVPTARIPHSVLGPSHINDVHQDMIIEEEVWIGANVTMVPGAQVGRGAVVGTCALVNKPVPPYAVVAGIPAKIIATTFTIDQIIEHEKAFYPEEERFSKEYLEQLFIEYFQGKKAIGISYISENDKILLHQINHDLNIKEYE